MASLEAYLGERVARGRAYFSREEALEGIRQSPEAFASAAKRLIRKRVLASPKRGFYIIIRPEDAPAGAPDPVRWPAENSQHTALQSWGRLFQVPVHLAVNR